MKKLKFKRKVRIGTAVSPQRRNRKGRLGKYLRNLAKYARPKDS